MMGLYRRWYGVELANPLQIFLFLIFFGNRIFSRLLIYTVWMSDEIEEVGLYRRWYVAELANFLGIADLRGPFLQNPLPLFLPPISNPILTLHRAGLDQR